MLRAAAGSVLYLALIALLSLGVAAAVRDSAVAIGVVLALLFLFPILSSVITSPGWHRHLEQLSPMTAGLYIQATTNLRSLPLTPWQGLGRAGRLGGRGDAGRGPGAAVPGRMTTGYRSRAPRRGC